MISLPSYLFLSFVLFLSGIVVIMARKNIVAIFLGMELILNAAALTFVSYARFVHQNLDGHIMSLFIIVIAATEAAVGLGIVIRFFQIKETVHVDDATQLQG